MTEAEHKRGVGRRKEDHELHKLAEDRGELIAEHLTLTRRRARESRERTWTLRATVVATFIMAAVCSYGFLFLIPQVRRQQDAEVCVYRSIANREEALARKGRPATRRVHRTNGRTVRSIERALSEGRTVKCRGLIEK
jgi:hypothetical protein